jgi:hypothetical protein
MIIETILSLAITHAVPQLPPYNLIQAFIGQPVYAKSFGSTSSFRSSSSSFRSSSSFSRPSSSFSRPNSSFSSRPSVSAPKVSAPKIYSSPRPISAPKIPTPSTPSNNIVRVNKQTTPPPAKVSAPPVKNTIPVPTGVSTTRTTAPAPAITRETYIERYNDGGIMGNPWFWMYMFNNNNQPAPQSAPIIVKDVGGEPVKVPQSQLIVQKDSHNPLREFAVFSLGGGIGVFAGSRLKSRF